MGNLQSQAEQAAQAGDRLAAAHAALKADGSIQFGFQSAAPPPSPPRWLRDLFDWLEQALRPIGRLIRWVSSFMPDAPYARIFLWIVLLCAAALVLATLYRGLRHAEWRPWRLVAASAEQAELAEEDWAVEPQPARAWLAEADELARQGRFDDAIRNLLFRSVEDISRRRPSLVRPALTSRELAAAAALPDRARTLFSHIAQIVERSLFGGQSVGPEQWADARAAYSDFALPGSWRE